MSATISERKIHAIWLVTQLEDENLLMLIESLLAEAPRGDLVEGQIESPMLKFLYSEKEDIYSEEDLKVKY